MDEKSKQDPPEGVPGTGSGAERGSGSESPEEGSAAEDDAADAVVDHGQH